MRRWGSVRSASAVRCFRSVLAVGSNFCKHGYMGAMEKPEGSVVTQRRGAGEAAPIKAPMSLKEFLEKVEPGRSEVVGAALSNRPNSSMGASGYHTVLDLPSIQLYCTTDTCAGPHYFDGPGEPRVDGKSASWLFATYVCRHCKTMRKTFALRIAPLAEGNCRIFKLGEAFPFGDPIPPRVLDLLGDEKEYFKKGVRAERDGLGIGAFTYYRRVVENKKGAIIDQFVKVAERLGAPAEMIMDLKAASKETQFKKAISTIKHGIPDSLKIDSHNPLLLLHDALSDGMHVQEDSHCLELASSIRLVLVDTVNRVQNVLKDNAELKAGVAKLLEAQRSRANAKASG